MANRLFKQFHYSLERFPVLLAGSAEVTQVGVNATLVNQGVTYTAITTGTAGNSITITLVDPPGNNVPLSIAVTGTAIVVTLATDGSSAITTTATQLVAALAADANVTALISVSGSGASALTALSATPLASGVDFLTTQDIKGAELLQSNVGQYDLVLQDAYKALLGFTCVVEDATATDRVIQLRSVDVDGTQEIRFVTLAGTTPTNIAVGDKLYFTVVLRNSAA